MRLSFIVPGLALAIISTLGMATGVLAHATIESVAWDNEANPTRVIATSGEDEIKATPGSYILHVLDLHGDRVDVGTPTISATNKKVMSVAVKPGLASGGYRVEWQTLSADDGDEDDGSFTLLLNKPAAAAAPAVVAAPAPAVVAAPAVTAAVSSAALPSLPAAQPRQAPVTPPSTGDAGLMATGRASSDLGPIAVLVIALAGLGFLGLSRKHA